MRSGFVSLVGRPNVGKSTLVNAMCGEKVSIVSDKPQSTRDRVVGIRTTDDVQMIVLDTPGLLNPRYELQRAMRSTALRALKDADVVIYLADATERTPPKNAPAQIAMVSASRPTRRRPAGCRRRPRR